MYTFLYHSAPLWVSLLWSEFQHFQTFTKMNVRCCAQFKILVLTYTPLNGLGLR